MKLLGILVVILFMAIMVGCDNASVCSSAEAIRETSPDKAVDVVVLVKDCGATTSQAYQIFITPAGAQPSGEAVFIADKIDGLHVSWTSSDHLLIKYSNARIFQFTNFWSSKDVDNFMHVISITERKK